MKATRWFLILIPVAVIAGCGLPQEQSNAHSEHSVTVEPRAVGRAGVSAGDPVNGARLYRVHCSSCHGAAGGGDGPAAHFVYPAPRDHTDASHMNRRSDQELHDVIASGGPTLGLSSLMPRWDDIFGGHQIWDLVAHVRTLHQSIGSLIDGEPRLEPHEIVLSDASLADAGRAIGGAAEPVQRKVTYFAASRPATSGTSTALVVFGSCRLADQEIRFGVNVDEGYRLIRARTFPLVVLHHRGFVLYRAVDGLLGSLSGRDARTLTAPSVLEDEQGPLAAPLVAAVRRLALQLEIARRQEVQDEHDATERLALYRKEPARLPVAERDFMMACAACHGPTGKGAPITSFPGLRSRNLSDGTHLNKRTDEQLAFVIAQGGDMARLSSAMPGFSGVFDERRIRELVAFLRTLARPQREAGRAP